MEKICFLFGYRDAQEHIKPALEDAIMHAYQKLDIRCFVVGNNGAFDRIAQGVLSSLKNRYPNLSLLLLIPYHPFERPITPPNSFDSTFYPPGMETVPRQFCISRANEYMIKHCDCAICCVQGVRNSRNLLEKLKKRGVPIFQISPKGSSSISP